MSTKKIRSVALFETNIGQKIAITHAKIDESGNVTEDNKKLVKIVVDETIQSHIDAIMDHAKTLIEEE